MRPNPEREAKIYKYWKKGNTIDETSVQEGIPRSTVGYFFKKFKRKYGNKSQKNIPEPTIQDQRSKDERIMLTRLWANIEKQFSTLMSQGRFRDAVDYIEAYYAYKRLANDFASQIQGEERITIRDLIINFAKYKFP
jgi:hypothetical protein